MRIFNLTKKTGSLSSSDFFGVDNGSTVNKIDYNALAKAIIEQYTGSTLAGSAQSVKAALDALNSKTTPISHSMTFGDKSWTFTKVGRIVAVSAFTDIKSASAGTNVIGTLPAEYRPSYQIYMGIQNAQNDNQRKCFLAIPPNGDVTFYTPVAISTAQNCGIGGTYISAT